MGRLRLDRIGIPVELARVNEQDLQRINDAIRDVEDFPKPGIVFKDITPVLGDGELFRLTTDAFASTLEGIQPDKVIGTDARGFNAGAALPDRTGAGLVPVRKKGKLPWETTGVAYSLEYGEAHVEIHRDAVGPGERVVLVDDLLATGGTAGAAIKLIQELGAEIICVSFLIELSFLAGRKNLDPEIRVEALLTY
ncbi:MAG: adenine phosphoribosyltransferase [Verrucomicrobiota bacterium]